MSTTKHEIVTKIGGLRSIYKEDVDLSNLNEDSSRSRE